MPEPNLTHQHELVLNAIDVISYRKNRPNIARIYRHLVRFSSISSALCEKLIDELVEQGRVIKVTYKGNISYRNAAKWKHMNRYKSKNDPSRRSASEKRASSILSGTIAELVVREPTYFRTGVPCKILEDQLLIKDGRFTKESIHKLLQKELKQETLVQLDNGNYFLALNKSTSNSTASEDSDSRNVQEVEDKNNEIREIVNDDELIEEIDDDDEDDDDDGDIDDEGEDDDDEEDEEELEEEEEEDEDDDEEEKNDAVKERLDSRTVEISGESEDEAGANDPFQHEDKDYLPPRNLNISTRRSSSGRLSVRNKKTRYDPSEYFIPSLKRTYKVRQEKNAIGKQQEKKRSNLLTSKEFKRALLNPIPGNSGGSAVNPIKTSVSTALQKTRLPDIPMKAVQFGSSDTFGGIVCVICNDSKVPVTKSSGARCKICQRKAHTACVKNEQAVTRLQVETSSWTCASCRYIIAQPCCVCYQASSKIGPLVICGTCKLSYHRSCHQPPIPKEEALTGSWRCSNCPISKTQDCGENKDNKVSSSASFFNMPKIGTITAQRISDENKEPDGRFEEVLIDEAKEKIIISSKASFPHLRKKQVSLLQINDSSATRPQQQYSTSEQQLESQSQTTSPTSSPPSSQLTAEDVAFKEEIGVELQTSPAKKLKEEECSKDIPDTSSWSPADVYNYFKDKFDDTVANVFLKQEIDGNSLKLLRRSDVLRGLGFKLGVGLNVLYHVKMLQLKTNDLKVIWAAE